MKDNPLRKSLSTDAKLVGGWLTLADPFAAEMIASVGFDYVVVDIEHWPADVPQALRCFQGRGDPFAYIDSLGVKRNRFRVGESLTGFIP